MFFIKKILLFAYLAGTLLLYSHQICYTQSETINNKTQYLKALQEYQDGKFEVAEEILEQLLEEEKNMDRIILIAVNNLSGNIKEVTGNYEQSITLYQKNIDLIQSYTDKNKALNLSVSYNNIGIIYQSLGKYTKALDFYNKAIDIILSSNLSTKKKEFQTVDKYFNMGLVYYYMSEYKQAIAYYTKSLQTKEHYKLKGIDNIYFNMAKSYNKLKDFKKAKYYYLQSIELREEFYGLNYFRLASLYMFYGDFLLQQKQFQKAKLYLVKAKIIYEQNYPERHPYTANSFVYLGKYYSAVNKPDSALYWYQKSLITNSKEFNSSDTRENPDLNDNFSGLQLLRSLKMKAEALQDIADMANTSKQNNDYYYSLKTLHNALQLVSTLRKDYNSTDNKLIITQEEKDCYALCIHASVELYKRTNNKSFEELAYYYVSAGKASVLSDNSMEENEITGLVPESIQTQKKEAERKISAYKRLLFEEHEKLIPDTSKIKLWNSKLFDLNNTYDVFVNRMKTDYLGLDNFKKPFLSIKTIQKQLVDNTNLVEYFISKDEDTDKQHLYIFVINNNTFNYYETELNETFKENIRLYRNTMNQIDLSTSDIASYNAFNKASYDLYKTLIEPIKPILTGENIIIVPDEELAFISFEALISGYKEQTTINYAELDYLIYEYCISYAYSTPLLINHHTKNYTDYVYAFAPNYDTDNENTNRYKYGNLVHTEAEINSILENFEGKAYTGSMAETDSFKSISEKGGILHLAMHASSEEENKEFSYLAFSGNQGSLYSYEIAKMNIESPMVVLSACNTGKGKLYSGEGVMSLSRSFIETGVPAVVHSLWNVNDDSGFKVMKNFYLNLAHGEAKNVALRKAKLSYIKESNPSMINPAYWSAYVLTGDSSPVKQSNRRIYYIIGMLIVISVILIGFKKIRS